MTNVNLSEFIHLAPILILSAFALAVLLLDVFSDHAPDRKRMGYLTLLGLGLAVPVLLYQLGMDGAKPLFSGMIALDGFGTYFNLLFVTGSMVTVLLAMTYFEEHGLHRGEFYALVLFATVGMMLMGMSTDLISFFVGLELMSISIYVLAGFMRHDPQSVESSLKYFLMGAFATGFLMMGVAYLYGLAGSTNLAMVAQALAGKVSVAQTLGGNAASLYGHIGMFFIVIGFGFKVASVPFHMWTPDVYQGAPTPVTAFMAALVKAAAFGGFVRIFATALYSLKSGSFDWYSILWVLAVLTMTWGNVVALTQDNIKRMLAYSSIAHAGYLLIGFLAISKAGSAVSAILFYLAAYTVMNMGAFAVVILAGRRGDENQDLTGKGWAGFGRRNPGLGAAMTLFMLSLAGIPGTIGFMGKFYVFRAAIEEHLYVLALLGVLNSLISVFYYLRVILVMFMKDSEADSEPASALRFATPGTLAVILMTVLTVGLGLLPSVLLQLTDSASKTLF